MNRHRVCLLLCFLLFLLFVTGCSSSETPFAASSKKNKTSDTPWDSTPKVLVPTADGTSTCGNESIQIDTSNIGKGYIMVQYTGASDKVKFFITTPANVRYTYDLPPSDSFMALPLTGGDGTYGMEVLEHVQDDLYSNLFQQNLEITLEDEFSPFLYPNQYTWFTADSQAVLKAAELTGGADSGLEAISNLYEFVIKNVSYDQEKADTVESGYLPNVDETLSTGKGICFDFAALMTAMLRSQGIPTKLEIGYSGDVYHAWISAYLPETGWIENIIEFDGKDWTLIDPTFGAANDAANVKKYVGDGSNYTLKYSR